MQMSQDAPLRFKVRCPHCDKVFIVSAPAPKAAPEQADMQSEFTSPAEMQMFPSPPLVEEMDEEVSPEEESFRERIVETILSRSFELPMLPHVALKVIRLTTSADVSMQDLAKVIMTDQMIATKVIKISNSPVYAGTVEISNINQALVRLGQTEIKNMMLAISLQTKIFKSKLYGKLAKQFWERSVGTAFAARIVAGALKAEKDEAFLCGLMHNLGRMVTLSIIEGAQREMDEDFRVSPITLNSLIDQYHEDVGELIVEKWLLPKTVGDTIRYLYRLPEIDETMKTVPIVSLAEGFCRLAGIGGEEPEELEISEFTALRLLAMKAPTAVELCERFGKVYEKAKGEFL